MLIKFRVQYSVFDCITIAAENEMYLRWKNNLQDWLSCCITDIAPRVSGDSGVATVNGALGAIAPYRKAICHFVIRPDPMRLLAGVGGRPLW